jgi:hypothetical protein
MQLHFRRPSAGFASSPVRVFREGNLIAQGNYAVSQLYSRLMTFSTAVRLAIEILELFRLTGSEA